MDNLHFLGVLHIPHKSKSFLFSFPLFFIVILPAFILSSIHHFLIHFLDLLSICTYFFKITFITLLFLIFFVFSFHFYCQSLQYFDFIISFFNFNPYHFDYLDAKIIILDYFVIIFVYSIINFRHFIHHFIYFIPQVLFQDFLIFLNTKEYF